MHFEIYAHRTWRRRNLGGKRISIAIRRSLQDLQNPVRVRQIVAIERYIVMSGAHPDRGIERAVGGTHGVISEARRDTPQVAPIEAQIPRVTGEHGRIFSSEIELLPRYTGDRLS